MKTTQILLCLLSFTFLYSCGQTDDKAKESKKEVQAEIVEVPEDWTTSTTDKFSIRHPKDWTADKTGQMGTKMIIFSPVGDEPVLFNENINIMTEDLPSDEISLAKYVEVSEKQIKQFITDANIMTSEASEINGKAFHKLIYTGKQGELDLKFQQYFSLQEGSAYILTLTTQVNSFDDYKEIGSQIMKSFQFL